MSSYQQSSLSEREIEDTRRQIDALVAEIADLSRKNLAPGQFYEQFLTRLISALAAIGGVVWTSGENNQLSLQYQMNLQQTGLLENDQKQEQHSRLLYKVMSNPDVSSGNGIIIPPHSGTGEDDAANATGCLLLFAPLRTDLEMVGLVEIFQRPETSPQIQQGYLHFLLQMCQLATDFLKSHQLRRFSDRQVLWARLEDFTRSVHASLEPQETAYTIANEARRLIECDRVSVALRKGNRCTIEAVSGQDVFDKRSNTVRLLGRLASAVVATGEAVWYAGDAADLAPQVEDAVQEYVDEAHSKMIAVLPLGRPKPDHESDEDEKDHIEEPVGALVVEQIEDNRVAPAMAQRIDVVCKHSSIALSNAMEHQNLFLMPLWRAIGKSRFLVQARTLPKTVLVVAGVLALLICLFLVPADFDLHAKGTLEPVDRSEVYANVDGRVATFGLDVDGKPIDEGSWVKKGQVLLQLQSDQLDKELMDIQKQIVTKDAECSRLLGQLDSTGSRQRPEEVARLKGQLAEARVEGESLQRQEKALDDQIKLLTVTSPITGQIVTSEAKRRLENRPVKRGDFLLRVADTKGPWELDLQMADDRMGHIARQKNLLEKNNGGDLHVKYTVATVPGSQHEGTVKEISPVVNPEKEEGNVAMIRVKINKDDISDEDRVAGASVSGKVYCGRRSLGYVWFHDLFDFIQTRIVFRFF